MTINIQGKVYQVNNSVIFSGKPIGSEEFLTGWEALGITIERHPKGRLRKMKS